MTSTLPRSPQGASPAAPGSRLLWRWAWRILLGLALLLVLYVVVTFVQVWQAGRRDAAQSADAIVVLGAAQYDCRPSPVLAQRLDHAHALYRDGVAGTIVVTGGKRDGDRCTEAQSSADHLRAAGVPDDDLLLEVQGRNSWESLAATGHILRDRGLTRVVLVTNGYHALRVQAIADQIGLDASVSPSQRGGSLSDLVKETAAVAVGRIVGFDRLVDIDDQVERAVSNDPQAPAGRPARPALRPLQVAAAPPAGGAGHASGASGSPPSDVRSACGGG